MILKLEEIKQKLSEPLPGSAAQYLMAPSHRPGPEFALNPPRDAREAAVLLLLYPDVVAAQDRLKFPMMLRPGNSGPHSGQISFPGGGREEQDSDLLATALRESYEEMHIVPENVEVLGQLSPLYVSPSRYLVYPYIGFAQQRPDFIPEEGEVEEILEFPLEWALEENRRKQGPRTVRDFSAVVPYFQFGEFQIWGASAMMLAEFAEILKK